MIEEKILSSLSEDEFLATNKVAVKVGLNWYKVSYILEKLLEKNLVERIQLGKGIFWKKLKNEK